MQESAPWQQFLDRQLNAAPLHYVTGVCNRIKPEVPCPRHWHAGMEAVFHPSGSGFTRLDPQQEIHFEERSVVLYAPQQPHDQRAERPGEDQCLQVSLPAGKRIKLTGALYLPRLEDARAIAEFQSLSRGYAKASPIEQAFLNARASQLILQIVHLALSWRRDESAAPGASYVREAERYMRREYQKLTSIEEVAHHVGLSANHLRHLFKTLRGKNMIAYLSEIRLERAQELLAHSRLPLKEIARLCGYKDEYYFSAVFRRHVKVAPGHYRRTALP